MTKIFEKVHVYDTIVGYLDSIKDESQLSQRVIGAMPNEIHCVYLAEKKTIISKLHFKYILFI
jgi:hypothetical protein